MSDKHTLRPWEWSADGNELDSPNAGPDWESVIAVDCKGGWEGCIPKLKISPANRAVIKSAPDLLDALRETTDVLGRFYRGESVAGLVLDALDSARAAIRKAEGREP